MPDSASSETERMAQVDPARTRELEAGDGYLLEPQFQCAMGDPCWPCTARGMSKFLHVSLMTAKLKAESKPGRLVLRCSQFLTQAD